MIYRIGNVEIEVHKRLLDFTSCVVHDHHGRMYVKETPMYKATIVGRKSWGRGRSPDEAVGDVIRTCPEAFGVPNA